MHYICDKEGSWTFGGKGMHFGKGLNCLQVVVKCKLLNSLGRDCPNFFMKRDVSASRPISILGMGYVPR